MVGLLFLICFAVPHFPVGVDVSCGGGGVEGVVVTAKGFEESEAFGDAGMVQEVIEGVFDQAGITAAVLEDFTDCGGKGIDRLLVQRLEWGEGCREVTEQALVSV